MVIKQKDFKKRVLRLIRKKKFNEALSLVEQKHSRAKNSSFFYSIYSMINIFMGNHYEAKLFLEKALRMNPNDLVALDIFAYTLLLEKQFKDAAQVYLKIIEADPKNRKVKKIVNNFKTDSKIKRYTNKLTPSKYFLGINYYFSTYQQITAILIVGILIGILIYDNFFKNQINFSGSILVKVRDKYEEKLFLTLNEIVKKKDIAKNPKLPINNRLINLNELLMTSNSLEEKIKMDHLLRRKIIGNRKGYTINKKPSIEEVISNPSKYDGISITITGKLNKELKNYKITTQQGYALDVKDRNRIITSHVGMVEVFGIISILDKKLSIIPLKVKDV